MNKDISNEVNQTIKYHKISNQTQKLLKFSSKKKIKQPSKGLLCLENISKNVYQIRKTTKMKCEVYPFLSILAIKKMFSTFYSSH